MKRFYVFKDGTQQGEAGADALVAGNAVFAAPDPEAMISQLHEL